MPRGAKSKEKKLKEEAELAKIRNMVSTFGQKKNQSLLINDQQPKADFSMRKKIKFY